MNEATRKALADLPEIVAALTWAQWSGRRSCPYCRASDMAGHKQGCWLYETLQKARALLSALEAQEEPEEAFVFPVSRPCDPKLTCVVCHKAACDGEVQFSGRGSSSALGFHDVCVQPKMFARPAAPAKDCPRCVGRGSLPGRDGGTICLMCGGNGKMPQPAKVDWEALGEKIGDLLFDLFDYYGRAISGALTNRYSEADRILAVVREAVEGGKSHE